jgi:eukaryotic-like serine/threonine-protein kinase
MPFSTSPLPQKIGRYRVESVLGSGAMGVVYLANDPHIQRQVALKTIRSELLRDEAELAQAELPARFVNEARAAGRLVHPHIVSVFDYGEADGVAYIALEYVRGENLAERLAQHARSSTTIPLARALVWFAQLLDALSYAHEVGVVHRDIKPANLLIAQRGECKVTDFGIAQLDTGRLTRAGMMIGTPSYMSPEQFAGNAIDARSDLFSAGVVLYEMLTGACPFAGTPAAVMQQVMNEMPAAPSTRVAGLTAELDAMVLKALAKHPDQRYASAQDWRMAVLSLLDTLATNGDPDHTVLVAPLTRAALEPPRGYPQAADQSRAGIHAAAAGATPVVWPRELLAQLEAALASHVGPVASLLVRRAAAQAGDSQTLSAQLVRHLPDDAARRALDALLERHAAAASDAATRVMPLADAARASHTAGDRAASATLLNQAQMDAAVRQLATHLGPIARIVAARAAQGADTATFYARLADALPASADRDQFLRTLGEPSTDRSR